MLQESPYFSLGWKIILYCTKEHVFFSVSSFHLPIGINLTTISMLHVMQLTSFKWKTNTKIKPQLTNNTFIKRVCGGTFHTYCINFSKTKIRTLKVQVIVGKYIFCFNLKIYAASYTLNMNRGVKDSYFQNYGNFWECRKCLNLYKLLSSTNIRKLLF